MTISKLSVILGASMDATFGGTMSKASSAVTSFASSATSAAGSIGSIAAGFGLANVVEGGIEKFAGYVAETFKSIDATAKLADSLGISTEALSKMEYAGSLAGASTEGIARGMEKLLKNTAEAQSGVGGAADAFRMLHLNAAEMINLPADQAFGKIADGLNKMSNASQRAFAAEEIFGKGAAELKPLLAGGSEGLAAAGAEAEKFHIVLSRLDAAKVEAANRSITKIEAVMQGAANTAAIQLAPYIEFAGNKLVELGTQGDGMAGLVSKGMHTTGVAIASAADFVSLLKVDFDILRAGADLAMAGVAKSSGYLKAAIDFWNDDPIAGISDYLDSQVKANKAMADYEIATKNAEQALDDFNHHVLSNAAGAYFQGIEDKATKAAAAIKGGVGGAAEFVNTHFGEIQKKLEEMQKSVDQFYMTSGQKAADDLKRLGEKDPASLALAESLGDQKEALDHSKKAFEELAKAQEKAWDETQTPMEKYQKRLEDLNALLTLHKLGLGGIDEKHYAIGAAKAFGELGGKFEPPKAMESGSQQAASYLAQLQQQGNGKGIEDRMLKEAQAQTSLLKGVIDAVQSLNMPTIFKF